MTRPPTNRLAAGRRTSQPRSVRKGARVLAAAKFPGPALPLLAEVLPGAWQIRVHAPFGLHTLQIVLTAQGSFRGELIAGHGTSVVEGRWLADAAALQLELRGCIATGCRLTPYRSRMKITFFDAQQIVGTTDDAEQMTWHKQTPAA